MFPPSTALPEKTKLKLTLNKTYSDLTAACITYSGNNGFELYAGSQKANCESYTVTVGNNTMLYLFLTTSPPTR